MSDKRDYYEVLGVEKVGQQRGFEERFSSPCSETSRSIWNPTQRNGSKKFKKPTPCFPMSKTGPSTIVLRHDGPQGSPWRLWRGWFQHQPRRHSRRDFFFVVFRRGSRRRRTRRLRHFVEALVELVDVLLGSEQEVVLDLPEICATCEGTGARGGVLETCTSCGGSGTSAVRQQVGPFIQEVLQTCSDCGGRGKSPSIRVETAMEPGTQPQIQHHSVQRARGGRKRHPSENAEGANPLLKAWGEPGDLFIEIEIETHPWFERTGSDLIMSLPLGYADLLLGTTVETRTPRRETVDHRVPLTPIPGETIEVVNAPSTATRQRAWRCRRPSQTPHAEKVPKPPKESGCTSQRFVPRRCPREHCRGCERATTILTDQLRSSVSGTAANEHRPSARSVPRPLAFG